MTAPSTKEGVKDVEVEKEDQMRINLFARKNARLLDIREKITEKEKELQNLEDASDELMMGDSDIPVPYQVGETFIHVKEEEAQEIMEKAKERLQEELTKLKTSSETIEGVMTHLKVQLYSKFGDNINLEAE
ncbi:Prefoldin subunit 4 [Geodia barretti]|uniref:Prefoldin subunit 4 n=1 Tax=Geodia barretti TaxID=519541 RepID=A0AA35SZ96_GEOBA|nr:Prefoldin subunit 4 [Geodia barretti]